MARFSRRLLLSAAVLAAGCLSPTLPLPPPADPDVEVVGEGLVELSGEVPEPAVPVIAQNVRTGSFAGDMADGAGAYRFRMAAEPGDAMRIWYTVGLEKSEETPFVIPTVGLPAPTLPTVTAPDASGQITVSGSIPRPLGQVFVSNTTRTESVSVAADSDGAYTVALSAESGDRLELWYEYGTEESPVLAFTVE